MSTDPWPPFCNEYMQPGKKVRRFYSRGNINNALLHIRAIVEGDQVVFRVWDLRGRCWRYKIDHISFFELLYTTGALKGVPS